MSTELKACPFCGGEADFHGGTRFQVICEKCGSRSRNFFPMEKAIAAWNTRPSTPQPPRMKTVELTPGESRAYREKLASTQQPSGEGAIDPLTQAFLEGVKLAVSELTLNDDIAETIGGQPEGYLQEVEAEAHQEWIKQGRHAALSQPAGTQWRPIETAPKDGTKIIGLNRHWKGFAQTVYWREYFDGSKGWACDKGDELRPDYWMPQPKSIKED